MLSGIRNEQYLRALFTDTNFNDTASAWLFPGITVLIFAAMALLPSSTIGIGMDWRAPSKQAACRTPLCAAPLSIKQRLISRTPRPK